MTDADILFACTRKTGDANFPLLQFSEFSIDSVFPINLHYTTLKTFMCGDLSALVKSTKIIRQNRLTHLCVAMVNRLGNSDESPM